MSSSSQNLYSHEPYNHRFKTQQIPMLIQTELVKENREQKKKKRKLRLWLDQQALHWQYGSLGQRHQCLDLTSTPMLIQTELVKENWEQKKKKTQTLARPAGLAPTVWFTAPKTPVFGFRPSTCQNWWWSTPLML
jgi:hypothetical protein